MAGQKDSYIAWDGSRYDGTPPSGWYLAADNRWWPSQDLLDAANEQPEVETVRPPADQGGEGVAPERPPAPTIAPTPPPSWAPQQGDEFPDAVATPSPPPTTPQRAPASQNGAGPSRPNRRRSRQRKVRPGFLIPVVMFLLFRFGVGAADLSSSNEVEIATETTADFIPAETTALANPTRFMVGDLEVRITGCGPGAITGGVTNTGPTTATFNVAIRIEHGDRASPNVEMLSTVGRTIGPLDGGEVGPLIVPLPEELDFVQTCEVVDITS